MGCFQLIQRVEDEAKKLLREKYDCITISIMKREHFESWSVSIHRLDGQPPIEFIHPFLLPETLLEETIEALIQAQKDQAKGIADIKQTLESNI